MAMRLNELIAEFDELDDEDKLEMLVEMADELPATSDGRSAGPDSESCRVQECQTAVYLWVDLLDDRVHIEADVQLVTHGIVSCWLWRPREGAPEGVAAWPAFRIRRHPAGATHPRWH